MKHVGILGGTFDPPHLGHLMIANEVGHVQNLDEVWFMPSHEPPHKQKATAASSERVAMVKRAVTGNPLFKIETIEVNRLGKSFTFDTMSLLKEKHPYTAFYFIVGADMAESLSSWKHINQLKEMMTFIGVQRKNYELNNHPDLQKVDIPLMEISSTEIKQRIIDDKPIKYMVPENVEIYIKEKRLYHE